MSLQTPFPFLELLESLKNTRRRGWVRRGVPAPTESVSDHMYRMAIMCRMAPGFDEETRARAEVMALVHDMGESLIGDVTPFDGISPNEKRLRERLAIEFLACTARPSSPEFANMVSELWNEYEAGETRTSQLVRQIDKMECMNQAVLYEERSGLDLEEFMALQKHVTLPELKPWLKTCLQQYDELQQRKSGDTTIIFVSGGPGVGKGTQCALAAKEFVFHHICVGDLLREEAASTTSPYKDFIKESIKESVLLPAQLTTYLIGQEMRKAQSRGIKRFLLDGFPRSVDQAAAFDLKVSHRYSTISLDCSEVAMRERLQRRMKSSNRIDDDVDVVSKRLRTFGENNALVLKYLEQRGPVHHIDCGRPTKDVYLSVSNVINEILQTQ